MYAGRAPPPPMGRFRPSHGASPRPLAPPRAAAPPQFSTTPAPIPSTPRPITTTAPLYIVTSATQGWKSIGFSGEGYNAARPRARGTLHAAPLSPPFKPPPLLSLTILSIYIAFIYMFFDMC